MNKFDYFLLFLLNISDKPIDTRIKGNISLTIISKLIKLRDDNNKDIPIINPMIFLDLDLVLSNNLIKHGIIIKSVHQPLKKISMLVIFKEFNPSIIPNIIKIIPLKILFKLFIFIFSYILIFIFFRRFC